MKLKEIMTPDVEVIHPDDSLEAAAQKMRERNIGFLPVCDGERLVGALTDRDITVRATADGMDPKNTQVRDLLHSDVFWCLEDQNVSEGAKKMQDNQVRRLMIVDHNKHLCGVVSLGDIANNGSLTLSARLLESVSEPVD